MEQRLIELERKISYQDKLIEELNEVVVDLSNRLHHLDKWGQTPFIDKF